MKIVHISNTDSGGAIELHAAMLENGIDSSMIVAQHDLGYVEKIYKVGTCDKLRSVISNIITNQLFRKINQSRGMYSYPLFGAQLSKHKLVRESDIIYFHFIAHSSFITLKEIERILRLNKPVIFITRDMWPITGGCHSSRDCVGYLDKCKNCPLFADGKYFINYPVKQLISKYRIYNNYKNLYFVGISDWSLELIKDAFVSNKCKATVINNCIDTDIFKPIDKTEARKVLNLPQDIILIGFGARDVNNPLKGGSYLKNALANIKETKKINFNVVTFGVNQKNIPLSDKVIQYNLGQLKDRYSMALFYNAVDIYVNPTLAEAFGNTAAESLSCGTPVVGFKVGGLIDIIDQNINGYLADIENLNDLIIGIVRLANTKNDREILENCREKAVRSFSRTVIYQQHMDYINKNIFLD